MCTAMQVCLPRAPLICTLLALGASVLLTNLNEPPRALALFFRPRGRMKTLTGIVSRCSALFTVLLSYLS